MVFRFIDDFEPLPALAPVDHAHILNIKAITPNDMEGYNTKYLYKLWVAIATMLFDISSETLGQFLDTGKKTFTLIQSYKHEGNEARLVIFRKGHEILVCLTFHKLRNNF
jgi:hypothetical protein